MPRYVIHIGPPKTGTKYLQNALRELRDELLADGITYPSYMWTHRSQFSHHELVQDIKRGSHRPLEIFFKELSDSPIKVVVLSCEGFVSLDKEQIAYLRRLTEGAEVDIVYFCRRWSDWLFSAWQQSVKMGSGDTFLEMVTKLTLRGPENEQAINFGLILDRYSAHFGMQSIKLMSYSNIMDTGGDIVREFLQNVLDCNCDTSRIPKSMNESLGIEESELLRAFNVLERNHVESPQVQIGRCLPSIKRAEDLNDALQGIVLNMKAYGRNLQFSDSATSLRPIYEDISRRYGGNLLGVHSGSQIFARKSKDIPYIHADYLLSLNILMAVRHLHEAARKLI